MRGISTFVGGTSDIFTPHSDISNISIDSIMDQFRVSSYENHHDILFWNLVVFILKFSRNS